MYFNCDFIHILFYLMFCIIWTVSLKPKCDWLTRWYWSATSRPSDVCVLRLRSVSVELFVVYCCLSFGGSSVHPSTREPNISGPPEGRSFFRNSRDWSDYRTKGGGGSKVGIRKRIKWRGIYLWVLCTYFHCRCVYWVILVLLDPFNK